MCCSMVTPHSKLHFKVYNRYQLKQDVLMGSGKLDMFVLLRQHSGRLNNTVHEVELRADSKGSRQRVGELNLRFSGIELDLSTLTAASNGELQMFSLLCFSW